jgi:phage terminase small subunit
MGLFSLKGGEVKMTAKKMKFCLEYFRSGNATQSAKDAGYSEKTAYSAGQRLLKDVEVKAYLQELTEKNASAKIADAREMQEVLTSIIRQEMDEENLMTEFIGDGMSETVLKTKKSSHKDVLKAIDLLCKMQGAYDTSQGVNVVIPIFGGEDNLED